MKRLIIAAMALAPFGANAYGYSTTCENGYSYSVKWLTVSDNTLAHYLQGHKAEVIVKHDGKTVAMDTATSGQAIDRKGNVTTSVSTFSSGYLYIASTDSSLKPYLIKMDEQGTTLISNCKQEGIN